MRTPPAANPGSESETPRTTKSRDADVTRQLLLTAARRRFAQDGYTSTTVRDIAADAGVNYALINRYFQSKEGLFEACLRRAIKDLDQPANAENTLDQVLEAMISQITDVPSGELSLQLLLLLRSSGDDRADQIRRDTLRSFTEGIASAAGWRAGSDDEHLLLRAQVAMAAALGIVLLRSSARLEPLTSATAGVMRGPISEVFSTLLGPSNTSRH